ncbi:MAG: cytochrome d ubiquinol oxidase subunit II [Gemmatimonadales bacterium]|nr:cytochrome d ubiquinol oxidase subunit II [Gemmatimonadales bacterium]
MSWLPEPLLPHLLAGAIVVSLTAYVLLAGADFGGGVWDFFATGERRARQRALIADAIGPIWEANHVWLILVVVLLFTCFPAVFARLSVTLHIPLTLMLVGIVARGSAFVFRTYDSQADDVQARWGRIFSIASIVTPVLLGMCVGAVVAGEVQPVRPGQAFPDAFVRPWLGPFQLAIGLLALVLFSFLAAVYLCCEAPDAHLQEDFRRRALIAGALVFVGAAVALWLSRDNAPLVWQRVFAQRAFALPGQLVTAASAGTALAALWARRYALARAAAVVQVCFILWGWALAQYPYLLPPALDLAAAAAPERTLQLVLAALGAGVVVLAPSLWYLFRVFKGPVAE